MNCVIAAWIMIEKSWRWVNWEKTLMIKTANEYTRTKINSKVDFVGVRSSQANMLKGKTNMITFYIITQPICKRIKIHDSCTQYFWLVWLGGKVDFRHRQFSWLLCQRKMLGLASNINRKYQEGIEANRYEARLLIGVRPALIFVVSLRCEYKWKS